MNIKKELKENKTLLLIMPGLGYNSIILDILRNLSGKKICYVTLNKTYNSLNEIFNKKKIKTGGISFIDTISKTIKDMPNRKNKCYFCSSPGALTEISITISKVLEHDFDYLVFDSLANLLIYQDNDSVAKFLLKISNKIRESNTKAIFYALNVKEQGELIKEAGIFVDKVIKIKSK